MDYKDIRQMQISNMQENFGAILTAEAGETFRDIDRGAVIDLLKKRGTILFRGFKASREEFDQITDLINPDYMNYKGGGYVRKTVGDSEAKGKALLSTRYDHGQEKQRTFGLPLHGEMYYTDLRPAMLWFYCAKPADENGETTACDGAGIYERLSPKWKELLKSKRLMFLRVYKREEWTKLYQTEDPKEAMSFASGNGIEVEYDDDTGIMKTKYLVHAVLPTRWGGHTAYINNLLTVYMQMEMGRGETSTVWFEDGSAIPADLMDEVKRIQDELTIDLAWNPGEFALLDNSRALHGRRAFEDTEREVYLRMVKSAPAE